jgi:hypothetical protein
VIPVENQCRDTLPPFPPTPEGVARLKHLPTVEACIHYWEAISHRAWEIGDDSLLETASGLKESYEQARAELNTTEKPKERKTARGSRKARPSS